MKNNDLGKTVKELINTEEWVSGKDIGLSPFVKYSPVYTYLPVKEIAAEFEKLLSSYSLNITKKFYFDKYYLFKILLDEKEKVYLIIHLISSDDKTRSFQINIRLGKENIGFFTISSFRKVHRGHFEFNKFMSDLKNFLDIQLKEENLNKLLKFYNQLKSVKLSYEQIQNLFDKSNKSEQENLKRLKAVFYYNRDLGDKLSILFLIDRMLTFLYMYSKSKLDSATKFVDKLIKKLIEVGVLIGF